MLISILNKYLNIPIHLDNRTPLPYTIIIMTKQHQHHNCEEDITILDVIDIISQP